jgi:hypothetical protein
LAFPAHDVFKAAFTLMPLLPVAGQEDHADAVLSRPWQLQANPVTGVLQKRVWDLQQDTSPITGIVLTTAGTTMVQIL